MTVARIENHDLGMQDRDFMPLLGQVFVQHCETQLAIITTTQADNANLMFAVVALTTAVTTNGLVYPFGGPRQVRADRQVHPRLRRLLRSKSRREQRSDY